MDKLDAMNAFAKVVTHGGYAEAARRLGLTRSAVSKAVMELEQTLNARLLDRTTRRVTPTEAGRAYYERCLAILAQVEETENQISRLHDEPQGVLKVNGPMSFGTRYLGAAVADFMTLYKDLKVELTLTDRFIDPTDLPTFIVGPDIAEGRLEVVLPNKPPTTLGIHALYAPNRYLAAKVRVFIDFLAARFGDPPVWDGFMATR